MASRLCGVAQAGQIILSEATFRKVQGDVAAVPLPPIRVKGKPRSCASSTPSGCETARSPPRTPARDRAQFKLERQAHKRMGLVAAVAKVLALVIAAAAALAAALIVLPSVSHKVALAAIVASERSALIAAAAVVALPLAFFGFTRGRRAPSTLAVVLAVAAMGMSLLPLLQARSLARTRGVSLDIRRYLQARIDTEGPGTPTDQTVTTTRR